MIFKVKTRYYDEQGRIVGNKAVITRKDIPIEAIRSIEEACNGRAKVMKTKCLLICDQPIGNIVVEKSFDQMHQILTYKYNENQTFIKGFIRYD